MTQKTIFALVDCNNFFVSCERLFRPELAQKPVVVLSSNDGCAVSRSNEAKAIGIPMGAPAFKYRQTFKDHGVVAFSANFELYGDMSRRITELLTTVTPRIEVYSVDESFLDLSQLVIDDYAAWGRAVRTMILKHTGIPVAIGIAPTKTLAKIATERAKTDASLHGACNLWQAPKTTVQQILGSIPIEEVWGVGRRLSPQLRAGGVATAANLAALRPVHAKQLMGIHGSQMVHELNGTACINLEQTDKISKSIARTRTFGHDTNQPHVIEAALASFASQAAHRLRVSGQLAHKAALFLTTDRHKPGYKRWGSEVVFGTPTTDTGLLIQSLVEAFSKIYDSRVLYHRAGVMLSDFVPAQQLQTDLLGFIDVAEHQKSTDRMQAIDHLNTRYGKRTVRYAAEELGTTWEPKHGLRSPRYTTNWSELPLVKTN